MAKPKVYSGIMVSSTFNELKAHRGEVIDAIRKLGFRANVMEISGAQADTDVIDTSIKMVGDAAAFVSVISHRYGQTPECPDHNPDALSISELEFNEAMRLERPILLFIMGDDHPVKKADIETDPEKVVKLDAFRERAKQMRKGSKVERIYEVFNSREDFAKRASIAVGNLAKALPADDKGDAPHEAETTPDETKAALPPELRAVPRYLGSHDFVGRDAELGTLNDWCAEADPNPMLLFEAIGGSGKSMVTWTWLTQHAAQARDDWAGRFWFSFYEGGATMTSFCQQALAYITGQPIEDLRKKKIRELMPQLITKLEARPWLIVLDGLERILVAYHRIDAPQMRDEDVDTAKDQISNRDPRAAINPEDEELLRQLAAAGQSKILVTSRLTPQALINNSSMPIPGVRREMLPGLRPADAEALLRACGVSGNSKVIRDYLQRNCDCHPLVIGALAGLVNNYKPDRGSFDTWLADPFAGGKLGLTDMNLTKRRNHILDTAIDALRSPDRKLLQTLSLLQSGADYLTLREFNPHLPPPPEEPEDPEEDVLEWHEKDDNIRKDAKAEYQKAQAQYLEARREWEQSPAVLAAPAQFDGTLNELERRGLLQYERGLKRYDLHPVVRGVAAGRMDETETGTIGSLVIDYFSAQPHYLWEQAETLEDLASGTQLVATLTRIGEFERALGTLRGDLSLALNFNIMASDEIQRLLRPFFPDGWNGDTTLSHTIDQGWLTNAAGMALSHSDIEMTLRLGERSIRAYVQLEFILAVQNCLSNMSSWLGEAGRIVEAVRLQNQVLEVAEAAAEKGQIFTALLGVYNIACTFSEWERADALWEQLDPMGRDWSRGNYRAGEAELVRANCLFWRGMLTETVLIEVESLTGQSRSRESICRCLSLRGEWYLSREEPNLAIEPLNEALRLYRESGQENRKAEALLALAQLRAKKSVDAHAVAEQLDSESGHATALPVAEIWRELDEPERAIAAALHAHKSACGSGEPYVYRYYLDRAEALLRDLGETPPEVPRHDPANDEIFDWEDDVRALIEKTRKEREAREEEERQEAERAKTNPESE